MKITRLRTAEQGGLSIKNCPHGDAYIAHNFVSIQATRPVEAKGQINPGDVVVFKPSHWCPSIWRPLAEHLEGQTFQYIAKAQGWAGETLVLQPWPCMEMFPSYFLAPAECLMTEQELRHLNERDTYAEAQRRAGEVAQ